MENVKDRFFKAFDYLKEIEQIKNLQEFADVVGTNKAGMSDIKAERKKVSLENLVSLTEKYPVLSIEWLVSGKGSMIKSYSTKEIKVLPVKEAETLYSRHPKVITVNSDGRDNVVLVPVKAAAGYLNGYGDPEFLETLPTFNLPNIQNGVFRMFQVGGHSMFPTLHNGSYVVGQFVENWVKDIKDDRVYVIVSKNDGITVKRCLNRIKKYGQIYCKSDNRKDYPNFSINPEEIIEVWEYKMNLSFELPNPATLYDRVSDLEATVHFLEQKIGSREIK